VVYQIWVEHLYNGYLAEYRSAKSFTDGMEWVINYEDKPALQEQARQTVMDKFAEPVIAQKHVQLYNQLVNKPQSGGAHV
jgi:glycosyltransferase involved in cell wall biosynthesis